jgi:hypothetical protein
MVGCMAMRAGAKELEVFDQSIEHRQLLSQLVTLPDHFVEAGNGEFCYVEHRIAYW